jgi:NAD(P)-dependent dehydrogenase (short-subunit alcohol dehydrogenase family)
MRFKDKVVLIVGGNSGIGLSAARDFAAEGAKVVITGRNPETLKAAAEEVGARAIQCDVADLSTLDACMDQVRQAHGRIDVLFVNAGIGTFAPVRAVTPAIWDEVHAVNLKGCFFAVQKALPLMGRGASVVITGSVGAVLAIPGNAIYAASKAGLAAAMKILAAELTGEGIRVNMVSPGPTETPLINRNIDMPPDAVAALRKEMISNIPMRRMGEPEEISRAVLFLASDEASFITGVDLYVDGGSVELR